VNVSRNTSVYNIHVDNESGVREEATVTLRILQEDATEGGKGEGRKGSKGEK
jgi:hypothetical protein